MLCQASRRGFAGALFEVDLVEFLVELGIADGDLLADAEEGLIEAEAGFDADDEEVDGVGNAFLNLFLALIDRAGEPDIGKQITDGGEGEAPEGGVGVDEGAAEDARDGADEAGGEIEVELAAALEAGGDEALAKLLIFRESEAGAEARARERSLILGHFLAADGALVRPIAGDDVENTAGLLRRAQKERRAQERNHAEDGEGERNVEKDHHSRLSLNVDGIDDAVDEEGAQQDEAGAKHQELVAERILEQGLGIARIHDVDQAHDDDGKQGENPAGQAALRGLHANVALNALAFANDVGGAIENFDEVAAGFALDHDRGDEDAQIGGGDAVDELHEGVAEREAEVLLAKDLAELGAGGLGSALGHDFDGAGGGMTGAERAGHHIDGVGESFFKGAQAAVAGKGDAGPGQRGANAGRPEQPRRAKGAKKTVMTAPMAAAAAVCTKRAEAVVLRAAWEIHFCSDCMEMYLLMDWPIQSKRLLAVLRRSSLACEARRNRECRPCRWKWRRAGSAASYRCGWARWRR